jgi:hypothetical protein
MLQVSAPEGDVVAELSELVTVLCEGQGRPPLLLVQRRRVWIEASVLRFGTETSQPAGPACDRLQVEEAVLDLAQLLVGRCVVNPDDGVVQNLQAVGDAVTGLLRSAPSAARQGSRSPHRTRPEEALGCTLPRNTHLR